MTGLRSELLRCKKQELIGNEDVDILPVADERRLSDTHQVSSKKIQQMALKESVLPARYIRNFGTMGFEGQLKLLNACVGVVGVGGLGGLIVELLARMGIGHLVLIDEDKFDDNNLNRQAFSTELNLGTDKVKAATERLQHINSATDITLYTQRFSMENGAEFLAPCDVIVDALDNMSSRFALQKTARTLGVPMIHGAIGGFSGQVTTIFPEDEGLYAFYPDGEETPDKLTEVSLGNPSATPAMISAWEVQETVKYLTGKGELLRGRLLYLDALTGNVEIIHY